MTVIPLIQCISLSFPVIESSNMSSATSVHFCPCPVQSHRFALGVTRSSATANLPDPASCLDIRTAQGLSVVLHPIQYLFSSCLVLFHTLTRLCHSRCAFFLLFFHSRWSRSSDICSFAERSESVGGWLAVHSRTRPRATGPPSSLSPRYLLQTLQPVLSLCSSDIFQSQHSTTHNTQRRLSSVKMPGMTWDGTPLSINPTSRILH